MARRRQNFSRDRRWLRDLAILAAVAFWLAVLAPAPVARADVIDDVNNAMLNIIQNTSASMLDGPPEVANEIQMVDVAMYNAINAASGSPLTPINYSGGGSAYAGADPATAALQAAVSVMNNLYGTGSLYQQYQNLTGSTCVTAGLCSTAFGAAYPKVAVGPTNAQMGAVGADIAGLQTELNAALATVNANAGSLAASNSSSLGNAVATSIIAANVASGAPTAMTATLAANNAPYVPPDQGQPGVYVPPGTRPALGTADGSILPVAMSSPQLSAVEASVPAALTSTTAGLQSSTYALQVLQTECQGSATALPSNIEAACSANGFLPESAAEAQAALFWNDPGGTLQPPGHWLQIADTVTSAAGGLSLLQTAQATAVAAVAMEDAGIATWQQKYYWNQWRPVTAIQDCNDWNPNFTTCDSTWASLIATPPHPDYLAGHPAFSGAAATALADILANDGASVAPFVSTSNTYCNAAPNLAGTTTNTGTTTDSLGNITACKITYTCPNGATATTDTEGTITACTQGSTTTTISAGNCASDGGNVVNDTEGNFVSCTYSIAGASCAGGGTASTDADGNIIGCTLDGVAETVTGAGCNNANTQPVLNADGTANALYNNSPLICPIAETFDTLADASGGYLGAEYSRVVGGIHTPDAVTNALALGDEVGTDLSYELVPEPPMALPLAGGLLVLGALRFRRRQPIAGAA